LFAIHHLNTTAEAPCALHPFIACERPKTDFDMTGTVCEDYSRRGKQKGRHGKWNLILLTWMKIHKQDKTRVLVHENVKPFDWMTLVEEFEPDGCPVVAVCNPMTLVSKHT